MLTFKRKITKGSRFNQVYIPKEFESEFEPGDLVEVKLVKKALQLYVSRGVKLTAFKQDLLTKALRVVRGLGYADVLVVGSFLTKQVDYNDIDLVILADKVDDELIQNKLTKLFSQRFHVLSISPDRFLELLRFCPLTRSMLDHYVSIRGVTPLPTKEIRANHIEYLLMFAEDLLDVDVPSQVYLKTLRRLQLIKRFVGGNTIDLADLLGGPLYLTLTEGLSLSKEQLTTLRTILRSELKEIRLWVKRSSSSN